MQRPDQEDVCDLESNKCIIHRCESCPGCATLKKFLDQELSKHEDDEEFNYCQWETTDRATLATITATYKEYKETLIDVIDDLAIHSYIAKLIITSSCTGRNPKPPQEKIILQVTSLGCILLGT